MLLLTPDTYITEPGRNTADTPHNEDVQRIFEKTDIFKQLSSIEEMLGLKAANVLNVSGRDKARPYTDLRDAHCAVVQF